MMDFSTVTDEVYRLYGRAGIKKVLIWSPEHGLAFRSGTAG